MTCRSRLLSATLLVAGFVTSAAACRAADDSPTSRPNIVLFLIDDMGLMDTSVPFLTDSDGNPRRYPLNDLYRTPAMERLAKQGIRFNQFCAMSVCSPTRVSLMTGQNAARHRVTNWINPDRNNAGPQGPENWNWRGLKPGDVTLAGLLQQAGYHTIHIGKGHFAPRDQPGADPSNLGFDINLAGASFGAPGSYYGTKNFGQGTRRAHHAVPHLEKYHGREIFLTEALTLEAKQLLTEAAAGDAPFFLYFSHYAVHAPFETDPRFAENYPQQNLSPQARAFATMIEGMDKSVGDVLDHLDKLGVAEDTLIFFLGDNGTDAPLGHEHEVACAAPLRGKKGSHYEGGTRVPFLAAWGKPSDDNPHQQRLQIAAGALQDQLAAVHDLLPTVLAAASVAIPDTHRVDGRSLEKLLTGERDEARTEEFLMHYPHAPHRSDYFTSLRDDRWKVIYHYFPSEASEHSHYQLFNLQNDPFEQQNLAQGEPKQLREMMARLTAALEDHEALYPLSPETGEPLRPQLPAEDS